MVVYIYICIYLHTIIRNSGQPRLARRALRADVISFTQGIFACKAEQWLQALALLLDQEMTECLNSSSEPVLLFDGV